MATDSDDPFAPAKKLYDETLDPAKTEEILHLLEQVKGGGKTEAKRAAYEAIIRLCDYLNVWDKGGLDLVAAAEEIEQALAIDPDLAPAYYAKGFLHRALDRHPEALAFFTKAVEIDDKYARAYAQKGNELLYIGCPRQALVEVQKAIDLEPDSPTCGMYQWIIGRTQCFLGNYKEAIPFLEKSIATWGDLWYSRLYLVSAYALLGDMENAERVLQAFNSHPLFGGYSIARVIQNETTNPNTNPFVVEGRRKFHHGLELAGMPLLPPIDSASEPPTPR